MKEIQRIITIAVGAIVLFFAYNFWFGSGIFAGYFAPAPPEGFDNLSAAVGAGNPQALRSAGQADLLSQFFEIVFTIVSTVGTVAIAIALKLIQWLSSPFEALANEFARRTKPMEQVPLVAKSGHQLAARQRDEYCRVMMQGIVEGDVDLTIIMAEKINGSKYLTEGKSDQPKLEPTSYVVNPGTVTEGGFPITGDKV